MGRGPKQIFFSFCLHEIVILRNNSLTYIIRTVNQEGHMGYFHILWLIPKTSAQQCIKSNSELESVSFPAMAYITVLN